MNDSSCCYTSSPALGIVSVLDFCHSDRYVVVPCCFNLQFPDDILCGASFHLLICHLYIFFGEVAVLVFCPFLIRLVVFLLLSIKSSLNILDDSSLSDMSFAIIFSQAVAHLLIVLTHTAFFVSIAP